MNPLDKHYAEMSFKSDCEDLKVMIDFITEAALLVDKKDDLQTKAALSLLKKIRYKMMMKYEMKKGMQKKFTFKLEAFQAFALLNVFSVKNDIINAKNPFEYNTISRYYSMFHQKLTGL